MSAKKNQPLQNIQYEPGRPENLPEERQTCRFQEGIPEFFLQHRQRIQVAKLTE